MQRLKRWWAARCWVVRSGVDSTWGRSNVDVRCAWWVPQSVAVERARQHVLSGYPTYGDRAILVRVERWQMRLCSGTVYRGWRVVMDKSGIFRAIYGVRPPGGF